MAVEAIGKIKFARPIDFFNLQISMAYKSNVRKGTNYCASAEGVGIGVTGREAKEFGDFLAFDNVEIYTFTVLCLRMDLPLAPILTLVFQTNQTIHFTMQISYVGHLIR